MSSLKRKGIIYLILAVIFIVAGAIFRACNLPSIFWIASFIIGGCIRYYVLPNFSKNSGFRFNEGDSWL